MSAADRGVPRFALDHNFPVSIVSTLGLYLVEAELASVQLIDPRLPRFLDWQLLVALDDLGWDGLVTTDNSMIKQDRELSFLIQTGMTLVVADGVGHDPVRATGLVLTHLASIAKQTEREKPQVWVLRAEPKSPDDPWDYLRKVAERRGEDHKELHRQHTARSLSEIAAELLRGGPRKR